MAPTFDTTSEEIVGNKDVQEREEARLRAQRAVCRTCQPTDAERAKRAALADKLVSSMPGVREGAVTGVKNALQQLPSSILQRVLDNGGRVVVAQDVTQYAPNLKGAPLINHEDQRWENAPGGTFDGKVSVIKADTNVMGGAVLHEFGHLYDDTGKKATGQNWDDTSLFTAGLEQDKQGLTAFDDLKGHNRQEEIFAESFAHYFFPRYRSRDFPDWDDTHPGITKFFDSMMDQDSLQRAPGVDAQKLFEAPAPATRGAAGK